MVDFQNDPDFIGLDADFFGDGETDDTTEPLSTYKENRIDGNNRALFQTNDRFQWTRRVDPSRGNAIASTTWSRFYVAPVMLPDEATSVKVGVDFEFGGPVSRPEVEFRARLLDRIGGYAGSFISVDEDTVQATSTPVSLEVDASEANTDTSTGSKLMYIGVDVRSTKNGSTDSSWTVDNPLSQVFAPWDSSIFSIRNDSSSNEQDLAWSFLELDSTLLESPVIADILGFKSGWIILDHTYGDNVEQWLTDLADSNASADATVVFTSAISVTSVGIEIERDAAESSFLWRPKDQNTMAAKEIVRGPQASEHARLLHRNYSRWRPVAAGPQSRSTWGVSDYDDVPWDTSLPSTYERWKWSNLDVSQTWDRTSFYADPSTPEIRVDAMVFATYSQPGTGGSGINKPGVFEESGDPTQDALYEGPLANVSVDFEFRQMAAGDVTWQGSSGWTHTETIKEQLICWNHGLVYNRPLQRTVVGQFYPPNEIPDPANFSTGTDRPGRHMIGAELFRHPTDDDSEEEMESRFLQTISLRIQPGSSFDESIPVGMIVRTPQTYQDANGDTYFRPETEEAISLSSDQENRINLWLVSYTVSCRGI